jgi:hypothetical protein
MRYTGNDNFLLMTSVLEMSDLITNNQVNA